MPLNYFRTLSFIAIFLAFCWFIAAIQSILLPFVFGILIAYFFDPTVDRIQRWGLGRSAATAVILGVFFSLLALATLLLVPKLVMQLAGLLSEVPEKIHLLQSFVEPFVNQVLTQVGSVRLEQAAASATDFSSQFVSAGGAIIRRMVESGMAFANLAALLVIAPLVSFYILRDWDSIIAQLDLLLPRDYAQTIREQVKAMDTVISGFIRGQLKVCATLALFYAVCLSIAGLKYALLISLAAGILLIIPYAGTLIAGVLAFSVALLQYQGDIAQIGVIIGIFVVGQMLEGYVLTPRLIGTSVGLHPMWIIFGMLAGGALMGFTGVLIAVPLTAVIGVLVRFAVKRYLSSALYASHSTHRPADTHP